MPVKPMLDRVLIEPIDPEKTTRGGIALAKVSQKNVQKGIVVQVGSGRELKDGTQLTIPLKENDVVLYNSANAEKVNLEAKELLIVKTEDILATLDGQ